MEQNKDIFDPNEIIKRLISRRDWPGAWSFILYHYQKLPPRSPLRPQYIKLMTEVSGQQFRSLNRLADLAFNGHKDFTGIPCRRELMLAKLLQQRTLYLNKNTRTHHFEAISCLENLSDLSLDRVQLEPVAFAYISKIRKLWRLSIRNTRLPLNWQLHLFSLFNLEELYIDHCRIRESELPAIRDLKSLRSLTLLKTGLTSAGLQIITKMSKLVELDIAFNNIGDDDLDFILPLKKLKLLYLAGTNVTNRGVKKLAGMKSLRNLYLVNTKANNGCIKYFDHLPMKEIVVGPMRH